MTYQLSEEQALLRDQARRFLAVHCQSPVVRNVLDSDDTHNVSLWQSMADLGWLGITIPEQFGGLGLGPRELCIVAEELGRVLAPVPFSSSIYLAAEALMLAGSEAQKAEYLPRFASADIIGTLALAEGRGAVSWNRLETTVSGRGETLTIAGTKLPVADGMAADIAVVAAQGEQGLGLYLVDLHQDTVTRSVQPSIDESRPQAIIEFINAKAQRLIDSEESTLDALLDRAAVYFCFEQLGGTEACLEMARHYVSERFAFGRAIGSFQAIKHRLAEMHGEYELAKSNCHHAGWALSTDSPGLSKAAAVARLSSSKTYSYCAKENIQVHGGIGFTWELDGHLHYRRAKLLSLIIGGERRWEEKIITALEATGVHAMAQGAESDLHLTTLDDNPDNTVFRDNARAWIAENKFDWDINDDAAGYQAAKRWQAAKHDAGWGCLSWPKAFGGMDAGPAQELIFGREENAAGVGYLRENMVITISIAAPTILVHGTEQQKRRYLPKMARAEETWCQLFSEPAAGSDLAGIKTRAIRDGNEWVVNGQKVWTSLAHEADWAVLVTRTDPEKFKHHGLTYFVVDMKSPGIEVRPIKQATGECEFNEVYLTDVRIPDSNRIGAEGEGWRVALTTLSNERAALTGRVTTDFDSAWTLAEKTAMGDGLAIEDSSVRSLLANWYVWSAGLNNFHLRLQSQIVQGHLPGPEACISKAMRAGRHQELISTLLDLLDIGGISWDNEDENRVHFKFFRSIGQRLEGGTDEILRNIIGERVLGLPPEPRVDKDLPFNQLKTTLS